MKWIWRGQDIGHDLGPPAPCRGRLKEERRRLRRPPCSALALSLVHAAVAQRFQHWCTKLPARKTGGNYSSCILIYVVYFHFHNHNQDVTATEMQVQSSGSPRRTGGICRKKLYDYASTITSTSTIAPIRGSCSYSYFVIEMIREKTK